MRSNLKNKRGTVPGETGERWKQNDSESKLRLCLTDVAMSSFYILVVRVLCTFESFIVSSSLCACELKSRSEESDPEPHRFVFDISYLVAHPHVHPPMYGRAYAESISHSHCISREGPTPKNPFLPSPLIRFRTSSGSISPTTTLFRLQGILLPTYSLYHNPSTRCTERLRQNETTTLPFLDNSSPAITDRSTRQCDRRFSSAFWSSS